MENPNSTVNTKGLRNSKYQIFQNPTKIKFQVYQHVEHNEGMEFDTLLVAVHGRKYQKTKKTRRKIKTLWSFDSHSSLIYFTNQDQREVGNVERKLLPPTRPPEVAGIKNPIEKPMNFSPLIISLPSSI